MNEISVVVQQEPGKVTWNFAEIKSRLQEELKIYQNTAYTDETIKTAKGDVADLRKLAKAIEDRRKEVKEKCLEPYAAIEAQAKELISLIDEPIKAINEQVNDYETRRKERVRAEIMSYYQTQSGEIPEQIKDKLYQAIYDARWENATATRKSWKEGIDKGIEDAAGAIETIRSFKSEFESDMLTVYYNTLNLQAAIMKMNELNAQKERILERERERREAEEAERKRKEEERRQREETEKKDLEEQQKDIALTGDELAGSASQTPILPETTQAGCYGNGMGSQRNVSHMDEAEKPEVLSGRTARIVRILGNEEQIDKILSYIRYTGADYEEV